jgi:dTDP-4-amino-4,6-dideoxygalactose transaminase
MPSPVPFGDLSRQYRVLQGDLDRVWRRTAREGWFVLGREVEAFEGEFSRYLGVPHAVGTGNGTDALHLALAACGVGPGDEVITVPNTAVPTVNAISASGAQPVLADVDPATYTLDPRKVERLLTRRTKALIPVHLYGHPADMDPLRKLARKRGLFLIEDACQAHGALYKGRKVGSLSDIACFSFYPSKNLGAFGDGGMAVTRRPDLARRLRLLRNHGQSRRYHHQIPGFNSRLDELQAAFLRTKLRKLDAGNRTRRRLAIRYSQGLQGLPLVLPTEAAWARHCFHLYVVRTGKRKALAAWLTRKGIQTLVHYPTPVHRQPAYRELGLGPGSFPVAERLSREVLSLPLFPELREAEVDRVTGAIRSFFKGAGQGNPGR